jgi:hypothetical protein
MTPDLTPEAAQGYAYVNERRSPCGYYFSSDCWLAWQAGVAMAARDLSRPVRVRKSRGYTLRITTANGAAYTFKAEGAALDRFSLTAG